MSRAGPSGRWRWVRILRGQGLAAGALVAGLALAGCTAGAEPAAGETTESPAQSGVVIEITIRGGEVSPTGEQVDVSVGQPVELHVDSDVAEELHLHTSPDKSFHVRPREGQVFSFEVNQPGQVELETEGAGVLVAQLVVRP